MDTINLKKLIPQQWHGFFADYFQEAHAARLEAFLNSQNNNYFPPTKEIMRAFEFFAPEESKVIICGQDPYHNDHQANGLAFSCALTKKPPSLRNILKELLNDFQPTEEYQFTGDLTGWAKQGVLLLNQVLTVGKHQALSHQNKGWEDFTSYTLKTLSKTATPLCFILWGKEAQKNKAFIDQSKHCILESVHPSPLSASRGFFNNHHFSEANKWLKKNNKSTIDWLAIDTY